MAETNLVKVAAVQLKCELGNLEKNVARACSLVEEAAALHAQIIALPELFNTGYFPSTNNKKFFEWAQTLEQQSIRELASIARKHSLVIIAPIFEKAGPGIFHNSAVVIGQSGEVIGVELLFVKERNLLEKFQVENIAIV